MGKIDKSISKRNQKFILEQKIFFVATATKDSRINLSPKGGDCLRIIDEKRVVWLNLTGSGNETAAHLLENNRITLMFCAFDGAPMILRIYGKAKSHYQNDSEYNELINLFPAQVGTRQLIDIEVELVQNSCGMSVPFLDFKGDRNQLNEWAEKKGEKGIQEYWDIKNTTSLDGKPTRL